MSNWRKSGTGHGEVREILKSLIESRFGLGFLDSGRILYKETIANVVEGVDILSPKALCRGSFADGTG